MYKDVIGFIKSLYPGQQFIPLHAPVFVGNEKKYVDDCIDSTFVSSVGEYVNKFEAMICDYTIDPGPFICRNCKCDQLLRGIPAVYW